MPHPFIQQMPVELRTKLSAVIRLNRMNRKRQFSKHVIYKLDRVSLVAPLINSRDPDSGAIINSCVLIESLLGYYSGNWLQEFNIDLKIMTRNGFFIPFESFLQRTIALIDW